MGGIAILMLAVMVIVIAGVWKMFEKAGAQGWMAIIPILNTYVFVRMAGKDGWWLLLMFIPIVNIVVAFIVSIEIAHRFDRSTGFGVGLVLLGFIFAPMLGFCDAVCTAHPIEL